MRPPDNDAIADVLEQVADLLEAQDGDTYRIRAYRNAARTARAHPRPLAEVLREKGRKGLIALPAIGKSIASAIEEFVHTRRLALLDRLDGQVSPEDRFTLVPGIGEALAHRIHADLHVDTLEELELAAHDGRLAEVPGMGARRVKAVREVLGGMLSRSSRRRAHARRAAETDAHRPDVRTLLAVDAAYRRKTAAGTLRRIAPRRFNPEGRAWLPVLHVTRGPWSITALFSNTATAHKARKTRDWVVLYYERDGDEGQCTVVTETGGPRAGRRVVRGRESEGSAPA